jgi:IPT/TIG domain
MENGFNQFVDSRARFTDDGQTAYLVTATATGDNATSRSFVYALDTNLSGDPPPPPDPSVFEITPPSGAPAGGSTMTIKGAGYVDGATVSIGAAAAAAQVIDGSTIDAMAPGLPPGTLNDLTVTNPDSSSVTVPHAWFSDFLDVPQADIFHAYVEKIFRLGITAGCATGVYCRDLPLTRAQMAVFLLKASNGPGYTPPSCTGVFDDVPCPGPYTDWVEDLAAQGITGGCGGDSYCPAEPVKRQQMAVLLLKTEHGAAYAPPPCGGLFADVACPSLFADWVEQLAAEQITGGCGPTNYCPLAPSTRGQMAVFLTKALSLQ